MRFSAARVARLLAGALAAVLAGLTLAAPPTAVGQMRKEVVVVVKIAGIPWFNRMAVGVERAGKQLGIKASLVGPSKADAASQVSMVEDLLNKGVPAIAVVPTDAKSLTPVFEKARARHIAIVTHENPFETGAVDYDIETIDNVAYGKLAVDQIVANVKKMGVQCTPASPCGYVQLVGGLTVPLHNFWADTATAYIKEKFPMLKELTTRLPTAESADDSRKAVLDLITTYGDKLRAVIGWGTWGRSAPRRPSGRRACRRVSSRAAARFPRPRSRICGMDRSSGSSSGTRPTRGSGWSTSPSKCSMARSSRPA